VKASVVDVLFRSLDTERAEVVHWCNSIAGSTDAVMFGAAMPRPA